MIDWAHERRYKLPRSWVQNQNQPLSPAPTVRAEVCAGVGGFLRAEGESESRVFVLDTSVPPRRWSVATAWRGSTIEKRGSCATMIGANDTDPSVVEDSGRSCGTGSRRMVDGRTERGSDISTPDVGEGTPAEGGVWGALINVDCSQDGVASPALGVFVFGERGLLRFSMGEEDGTSTRDASFSAPDRALIGGGRLVVE